MHKNESSNHISPCCGNCKYAKWVHGPYLGANDNDILTCEYIGIIVTPNDWCREYEYSGGE